MQNSITTTSMVAQDHDQDQDQDQDLGLDHGNESDLDLDGDLDPDHSEDGDVDEDEDENDIDDEKENTLSSEPDRVYCMDNDIDEEKEYTLSSEPDRVYCMDNNPPESFSVCQAKVADWLNHHTFIERKSSVKFAVTKNQDYSSQTGRSSHRLISLNQQRPKLSIIGFRKKPVQQTKQNDKPENIRLFRNRSEPGRDYCLLITEPVSPRVSCVGRVGSVRVRGRKAGVWRSVKAAFSNLVQTNKVMKIVA